MLCKIDEFQIGSFRIDDAEKANTATISPDSIKGYRVVDFSLSEELMKPNEFTFTLRRDKHNKNNWTKNYLVTGLLLGKEVRCKIKEGNSAAVEFFKGSIAKVSMKGLSVTCVAYSTEAELQCAPRCRCFFGKKLDEIVNEVLNAYQDNGNAIFGNKTIDIHSDFKGIVLPYVVQYNESDYDFLVRLAKRFGAFFFYNPISETIVFGKIPSTNVDHDLTSRSASVSYELETVEEVFRHVAYDGVKAEVLQSTKPNVRDLPNTSLMHVVVEGSHNNKDTALFIHDPNRLPNNPDNNVLVNYTKNMASSMLGNNTKCKFVCYDMNVHVGDVVQVDVNDPVLVTSARFTWEGDGSFQSENTAMLLLMNSNPPLTPVANEKIFAPYMDINAYPRSSAQRAIVVDNVDPLKMGRVMVRFAWQDVGQANYSVPADDTNQNMENRKQYPWIRIAQPYGGNNKGCFILPEIGEEVMVGFEDDNMEKPFIIGSLFHDSATAAEKQMPDEAWVETRGVMVPNGQHPANQENEVKAFRTKKGHTIEIHDTKQGDGFIRIYDKNKGANDKCYEVVLSSENYQKNNDNGQKENVKVTSPSLDKDEGFDEIEVKELRIMVRSNGGDIVLDAGDGDIIMRAKNIRSYAGDDRLAYVGKKDYVKVGGSDNKGKQIVDVGISSVFVNDKREVNVKNEDRYTSSKLKMDVDNIEITGDTISTDTNKDTEIKSASNIAVKADQKTEIRAKSFSSVISDSAEIKAKSIDTNAANDFKLTVGKNASIHSAEKVDLLGMTMKIQGQNTDITGTFFNIKATTQGTRSGQWTDM